VTIEEAVAAPIEAVESDQTSQEPSKVARCRPGCCLQQLGPEGGIELTNLVGPPLARQERSDPMIAESGIKFNLRIGESLDEEVA
jgi:hypothetical protein